MLSGRCVAARSLLDLQGLAHCSEPIVLSKFAGLCLCISLICKARTKCPLRLYDGKLEDNRRDFFLIGAKPFKSLTASSVMFSWAPSGLIPRVRQLSLRSNMAHRVWFDRRGRVDAQQSFCSLELPIAFHTDTKACASRRKWTKKQWSRGADMGLYSKTGHSFIRDYCGTLLVFLYRRH